MGTEAKKKKKTTEFGIVTDQMSALKNVKIEGMCKQTFDLLYNF
jgi:hypothetical protein